MMPRRVAITGLGVVSGAGSNVPTFWANVIAGSSQTRPIAQVDGALLGRKMGVEVQTLDLTNLDPRVVPSMDRFAQFAAVAAAEAVASAGLDDDVPWGERGAVCTGTSIGGQTTQDDTFRELYASQRQRLHPLTLPRAMSGAGSAHLSMRYGITGPSLTFGTACAAANHAIGHAFWMVRQGTVDRAIAGGSEAPFSYGNLKAWEALHALAPDSCRPFSSDRQGTILGEGAAMLVLEPLDVAAARGAHIYAEVVGFGMGSDAFHLTQPTTAGAARAMRAALTDAALPPDAIGYLNAHGTGTPANDLSEADAIRDVFGDRADVLPVSSTKAVHGHGQGATGGFEAVATVMALQTGALPPTASVTQVDPKCRIQVITGAAVCASPEYAVSNTFAFGGMNAVLAFRRWSGV